MRNTTSPSPTTSFESIDAAILMNVQGGCGKKKCCNCGPQAIAIAAAPAPAPAPAPVMPMPMPSSPSVETSVSVSYQ